MTDNKYGVIRVLNPAGQSLLEHVVFRMIHSSNSKQNSNSNRSLPVTQGPWEQ